MKEIQREHIEAFLFSLPDDQTFLYRDCSACFIATFLRSMTGRRVVVDPWSYYIDGARSTIPDWLITLLLVARNRESYRDGLLIARELKSVYLRLFPETFIASESHQPEGRVK